MIAHLPTLAIVVPCYNEQDVLPETARRLDILLKQLVRDGRIAEDIMFASLMTALKIELGRLYGTCELVWLLWWG